MKTMRSFTDVLANNFGGISLKDIRRKGSEITIPKNTAESLFGQGVVYTSQVIGSLLFGFSVRYIGDDAKVFVNAK